MGEGLGLAGHGRGEVGEDKGRRRKLVGEAKTWLLGEAMDASRIMEKRKRKGKEKENK